MVLEVINGRYEVERRIGSGGMGDVWLANDILLGRYVALKFVGERSLRETPGSKAILQDEARNAGQLLGHPNIVAVLDLIEVDTPLHKGPAVVLEYVEGINLAEWLSVHHPVLNEKSRFYTSLFMASEILEAIAEAHNRGIIHRDIKPQNVLLSASGRIKVADFGLSRVVEAITRTHTVWANHTPLYSAPEQWEGDRPSPSSDIYQLCATLYHLFAGRPANEGVGLMGLGRWHEVGSLTPLIEHAPQVDQELAALIERGLSKADEDRPALWELFDAVANSLPHSVVSLKVEVEDSMPDEQISRIISLTDFNLDKLLANRSYGPIKFPQPLEGIREGIGASLLGAMITLD